MPRFQQHGKTQVRTFFKGANTDQDPEIIGAEDNGEYFDGRNVRILSSDGHAAAAEKIKGEEVLFDNKKNSCTQTSILTADLPGDYKCIGQSEINNHLIEFWAEKNSNFPSLIRIDGEVVLYSSDFPINIDHPLQIDKNERCVGGEIYITASPCWSCFKMLANSGVKKIHYGEFYRDERIFEVAKKLGIELNHIKVEQEGL